MGSVQIIEYADVYRADSIRLLCQLQEYLISVDDERVQTMSAAYQESYLDYVIRETAENDGIILLALKGNCAVGLIAGWIESKDEIDQLSNRCPRRGIISELVIAPNARNCGIGKILVRAMEERFLEQECEFVAVDVFAPNNTAVLFYESMGYSPRNIEMYKRLREF